MNLLSLQFLVFGIVLVIAFYAVPKRFQWWVLLIASMLFYSVSGIKNVIFIMITATSTFLATNWMQSISEKEKAWLKENKATVSKEEKSRYKAGNKTRRKAIFIITLLLNIGLLCVFKYLHFVIAQINAIISVAGGTPVQDIFQLIIPMGISFYTFQTVGYLTDVYWKKVAAEKNFFKVVLFTSFFAQVTQGPISEFKQLTGELFKEHTFTYHNYSWGIQRMFWGFFKKMVVANILAGYVQDVFANYPGYTGLTSLVGALMYSIQIYADFSGYMDIVCGLCEVLDIRLTENFMRPYFSKSIAEYWRRWHISLGAWFKTYVYYPIAMARWNQRLGRNAKKIHKSFGQNVPATIALVVTWLTTGLWHGASWGYIAWGGVNGLIIIFSMWMEPLYDAWKQRLHINELSFGWRAFQVIRTFTILTFIKMLPEVGTLAQGFGLWHQIFTNHEIPTSLHALLPFVDEKKPFLMVCIGTLMILVTSLIQRKQPIRQWFEDHTNYYFRIVFFAAFFILIVYFGYAASGMGGGFMYEKF